MNIQQRNSAQKLTSKQLIKWIILWKELSGKAKRKGNKTTTGWKMGLFYRFQETLERKITIFQQTMK